MLLGLWRPSAIQKMEKREGERWRQGDARQESERWREKGMDREGKKIKVDKLQLINCRRLSLL